MRLLLTFLILCLAVPCFGDTLDTSRGVYVTPVNFVTNYLNNNDVLYHKHQYDKRESPFGVGLDAKVWDFQKMKNTVQGLDAIGVEYRYDDNNNEHSVYFVGSVDLTVFYQ